MSAPKQSFAAIETTALQLLAQREHTQFELCQKLQKRGYHVDDILLVLAKLVQEDWQSDQRFAELYVAERASKGYGPIRISQELQQRGLTEAIITSVFSANTVNWVAYLEQAYYKKFKSIPPADLKEKAKHIRFLQYRGFDLTHICELFPVYTP